MYGTTINFASITQSVLKKGTVILCTCLIGLLFAGCDKLRDLRDGIEEGSIFRLDTIPDVPFTEDAFMDTLKGEWSWFKTYGGIGGRSGDNRYKSVIKILGQNEDGSINYEVWLKDTLFVEPITHAYDAGFHEGIFVEDTLFYKGSFQFRQNKWYIYERSADIELPHWIFPVKEWIIRFGDMRTGGLNSRDILIFWGGDMDGYFYYYKREE